MDRACLMWWVGWRRFHGNPRRCLKGATQCGDLPDLSFRKPIPQRFRCQRVGGGWGVSEAMEGFVTSLAGGSTNENWIAAWRSRMSRTF
jgi:hypothetical protein